MTKIIFYILCFFEIIYKAGFACFIFFKTNFYKSKSFNFKIISVGNISVGGTGKSVFVQFLAEKLKNKVLLSAGNLSLSLFLKKLSKKLDINIFGKKCAIVLRGYKGKNEKKGKSFLVTDGKNIFCEPSFCGDEAYMFAQNSKIPVVVGSDRAKSCELLQEKFKDLDIVILDDAYQNFAVKKDLQILLMDARKPFENGHCLPAGMLREKDYSRTDFIVLTHADLVSKNDLSNIQKTLLGDFDKEKIFEGSHKVFDISLGNNKIDFKEIKNKRILAFAGIGSFNQFVDSVENLEINVCNKINYKDHYKYKIDDLKKIKKIIGDNKLDGAITTQKDFVKLFPLIKKKFNNKFFPLYILNISFEFSPENR